MSPRARAWLVAIRPATLPAAIGPVLVGLAVAWPDVGLRPLSAAACLAVALLFQVAANLANDLFDYRSGADAVDRLGPPRAAASGLLTEGQLAAAIVVVLSLAGVVGLGLVAIGGPVVLALGILAALSVLAYTGGPWPYGYHGLGEIFVFAFFGVVAVAGTAYVQLGRWPPVAFAAAIPVGALVTAILVVNNLRDIDSDRRAGKRTLAVSLGRRATIVEYVALLVIAYAVPPVLVLGGAAAPVALLPLASLPLAVGPLREVADSDDPRCDPRRLNPVLKATARLALVFSSLLAIGLAVGLAPGLAVGGRVG
jgi:1,4-dihydroxy-2-naphthoate octaprenyltransferase